MADITRQVAASADDARAYKRDGYYDVNGLDIELGRWNAASDGHGGGMRFTNITIPKGATIDNAHLTFRCREAKSETPVYSRISAEDIDDAPNFAADDFDSFMARFNNHTTARIDWDNIPAWAANTWYDSPEIWTVIKEIVDRGSWTSGNDIVIFVEDYDYRSTLNNRMRMFYSWDRDHDSAVKLYVAFTPPIVGWTGKISGVTNPAKIMGVDVANIAKVKGVS